MKTIIVGAGSAGMEAAITLAQNGERPILIDVEERMGGIINQCIHSGFGIQMFQRELTGPEFAEKLEKQILNLPVDVRLNTFVKDIQISENKKQVVLQNPIKGEYVEKVDNIIVATGARERTPAAVLTPGQRVSGIYTAGLAQTFMNIKGWLPGNKVLIVGSGDIGLIMARRLTLEGAEVVAVIEINPFPGGLPRNIKTCLNDFNIPLLLSRRVVHIEGQYGRVSKVFVAKVDENYNIISDDYEAFEVDTVLFSVGLIPNTGLLKKYIPIKQGFYVDFNQHFMTSIHGIYVVGNSATIFDLADHAALSGKLAALSILKGTYIEKIVPISYDTSLLRSFPSYLSLPLIEDCTKLFIRVRKPIESGLLIIENQYSKIEHPIRHQFPAQMIEVCLPIDFIKDSNHINITVEV